MWVYFSRIATPQLLTQWHKYHNLYHLCSTWGKMSSHHYWSRHSLKNLNKVHGKWSRNLSESKVGKEIGTCKYTPLKTQSSLFIIQQSPRIPPPPPQYIFHVKPKSSSMILFDSHKDLKLNYSNNFFVCICFHSGFFVSSTFRTRVEIKLLVRPSSCRNVENGKYFTKY